jgi:hypothetical protein
MNGFTPLIAVAPVAEEFQIIAVPLTLNESTYSIRRINEYYNSERKGAQ